ncbi:MAG: hypothetical protein ABJ059_00070, partial [Hyphomicrobiales bacterium]
GDLADTLKEGARKIKEKEENTTSRQQRKTNNQGKIPGKPNKAQGMLQVAAAAKSSTARVVVVVFFTLNRSFYPSTSSTTSVRADSSTLERYKFCGHKATPHRFYVATCAMQLVLFKCLPRPLRGRTMVCCYAEVYTYTRYIYIFFFFVSFRFRIVFVFVFVVSLCFVFVSLGHGMCMSCLSYAV